MQQRRRRILNNALHHIVSALVLLVFVLLCLFLRLLLARGVLTRIGHLIFEDLDEVVETYRTDGTAAWSNPVYPVLLIPDASDDAGPKGSGWVQRPAGVVHSNELSNEERNADANRGQVARTMLLFREHEDSEDQLGSQEAFDEYTLHKAGVFGERRANVEVNGKQHLHNQRGDNRPDNLCAAEEDASGVAQRFDHDHAKRDGGVEESA